MAAGVLASFDVSIEEVRAQVVEIVGAGAEVRQGQLPFTSRAKKVLELSIREALALGHNYIGTEHILLGLVREDDGVGARILNDSGVTARDITGAVLNALDPDVSKAFVEQFANKRPAVAADSSAVTLMVGGNGGGLIPFFLGWGFPMIAGALLFGTGLLVGWLIWG